MKTLKYIGAAVISLGLISCEKSFLDLQPVSELTDANFYEDADQIEAAVNACYDGLQSSANVEFMITELRSDNATTLLGEGDFGLVDNFADDQNLSLTQNYWTFCYNTIMRCNVVLQYSDVVEDAGRKAELEGEARFIRAFNYFNLVRLFGEVPLILEVTSSTNEEAFANADVPSIYNSIVEDLEFATQNLPSGVNGRANVNAAQALLGKVHLTLENYSEAESALSSVITSGVYSLNSSYPDVFALDNELNDEIIFAVEYKSQSNLEGQDISDELSAIGEFAGINTPTEDFIAGYDANDTIRKSFTVTDDPQPLCGKFLSTENPGDADNDWIVLRYADVLLMYGEVLNELNGPTQEALDYLNETRTRAGLSALTSAEITSADDYRLAMEEERQYELAFENHRWFDLLRTDRALTVMNAQGANQGFSVIETKLVYAIPQREIDVSNGYLKQNDGY